MVGWGRWAAAAAVLLGTIALGTASAAAAESCPVLGVAGCPAPQPGPTPTTTVAPAPTTPAPPPTTSTTVPAQLTPAQARARLVELVNAERARHGLQPLAPRDDVTDIAMGWSDSMAKSRHLSHNDAYFSKENRQRLGARAMGENVAYDSTIDHAHQALMASEQHRANILDARFNVVGFGAVLRDGTWWVTEDFLQTRTTAAPAPAPAPAPASANAGGGGVERARGAVTAAPKAATVPVNAASTSNPVLAADEVAGHLVLVPTTMMPPVGSDLAGEPGPSRQLRVAAIAVALLLAASVAALRKAMRRATRLTAPGQLGLQATMLDELPELAHARA